MTHRYLLCSRTLLEYCQVELNFLTTFSILYSTYLRLRVIKKITSGTVGKYYYSKYCYFSFHSIFQTNFILGLRWLLLYARDIMCSKCSFHSRYYNQRNRDGHRHLHIGRMLDIDLIPPPPMYVSKVWESVWPEGAGNDS